MKVIAMVRTTVPMEIEVDNKFETLVDPPEDFSIDEGCNLEFELLAQVEKLLPDTGYHAEVMFVKSTDGQPLAEW